MQIDERSRRKPGWTDGGAAELADGRPWHFPRTRLRLAPRRSGEGVDRHTVASTRDHPDAPRLAEWIATITAPPGAVDGYRYWDARMDAAATLLRINYELSDDELAALLAWVDGDEASAARWAGIDACILGHSTPKASPAG